MRRAVSDRPEPSADAAHGIYFTLNDDPMRRYRVYRKRNKYLKATGVVFLPQAAR
jgi:hypothetical protein